MFMRTRHIFANPIFTYIGRYEVPYSGKAWRGECLVIYSFQVFGGKKFDE